MPKRIANNTIILTRPGVGRIRIPAGKQFDFTSEELADLKETAPNSIRTPRDETESVQEVVVPKADGKGGKQSGKQGKQGKQQAESKPEGEEGGAGGEGGSGDGEEEL